MFLKTSSHTDKSDKWLLEKYRKTGDLYFLGILFQRYMHLVYGVCLKYLREQDLSKDNTLLIFEKLVVEVPKREIEDFKAWLYVVTKNHCLMTLRASKSRISNQKKYELEHNQIMENDYSMHLDHENSQENDMQMLHKCIEQLKKEQKECIKLFYLDEKCYREISERLEIDIKKVKSFIQNGKRNLKICMEENG